MITGKTQILGVIGDPVTHSLSPVMHNAALAELGADFVYVAFPIATAQLETAVAGLAAIGVSGFNVTIPHKQAIMPLLSKISAEAQAVGAVNTVWRTERGWAGTNTDVLGFVAPLQALRDWSQAQAVILGNGGAARAVVAGCAQLGLKGVSVVGRNPDRLQAFQLSWQGSPFQPPSVHPWEALPDLLPQADLVVNTTPIGMHPQVGATPLDEALLAGAKADAIAYDLIYTPSPTQFLSLASQHGLATIDGLEMLVQQGAAALKIWLQSSVPVDTMRQALKAHLGH
ncbi:shikimate dehydrogenase [Pseudanabaena sp. FACHB-2040]|uniref:shikimate dehydrogenase n=1 Tax=Pseudanabaena sp. FACHB-2040 TaxID=2692859 RepID=UPI001685A368|nr:shikimate dehydrogenase [Pseudanabaena sp. FACHB-2040]MBD2259987.1 shikimate dehydrogenase [Pseudanabaena sp. FACHB-2040]